MESDASFALAQNQPRHLALQNEEIQPATAPESRTLTECNPNPSEEERNGVIGTLDRLLESMTGSGKADAADKAKKFGSHC